MTNQYEDRGAFCVMRHGEVDEVWKLDHPREEYRVSELGFEKLTLIADEIKRKFTPKLILTSQAKRAVQSGEHLRLSFKGSLVETDQLLNEANGDWQHAQKFISRGMRLLRQFETLLLVTHGANVNGLLAEVAGVKKIPIPSNDTLCAYEGHILDFKNREYIPLISTKVPRAQQLIHA